jgi:GTP cyclohydrolase I
MIEYADEAAREKVIASHVQGILIALGEDPTRDGLLRTPTRVAKALIELAGGADTSVKQILDATFDEGDYNEMVVVEGIPVQALCEHHILPFIGTAVIGYIPGDNRILGLSKLARLTEHFSRRLQVQERLTSQIARALWEHLRPVGVGVVIKAEHLCMALRGARCAGKTTTSYMLGSMREDAKARAEFLVLANRQA